MRHLQKRPQISISRSRRADRCCLIPPQTAASTTEFVAELRLGIRITLAAAVHAVAAHHFVSALQVIDEESCFKEQLQIIQKNSM